jgi:DNA-directed RNA polymerase specialized sigma24 family protein
MDGDARRAVRGTRLAASADTREQRAWDALVERYTQEVWDTVRAHGLDTDTAAQVSLLTWLRLTEHLAEFASDDEIGPWLCGVARGEALAVANRRAQHGRGRHSVAPTS